MESIHKHIAIEDAINSISSVTDHAEILLSKINGQSKVRSSAGEIQKQEEPTLKSVLDSAPDNIRNMCDQAHSVLEEINKTLF